MKKFSLSLISILVSCWAWAATPNQPETSSSTVNNNESAWNHETSAATAETQNEVHQATENHRPMGHPHMNSKKSQRLESRQGWTDRNEIGATESERTQPALSGSSTRFGSGQTMHDLNKALEMCRSVNPDRDCTQVSRSCMGSADLESCIRQAK